MSHVYVYCAAHMSMTVSIFALPSPVLGVLAQPYRNSVYRSEFTSVQSIALLEYFCFASSVHTCCLQRALPLIRVFSWRVPSTAVNFVSRCIKASVGHPCVMTKLEIAFEDNDRRCAQACCARVDVARAPDESAYVAYLYMHMGGGYIAAISFPLLWALASPMSLNKSGNRRWFSPPFSNVNMLFCVKDEYPMCMCIAQLICR